MELDQAQFYKLETVGLAAAIFLLFFFFWPVFVYLGVVLVVRSLFMHYKRSSLGSVSCEGKTVLITGCDSGFGLHLAERLHTTGFTVCATCLHLDSPGAQQLKGANSDTLQVLQCDVSSDDSVAKCLRVVRDKCGQSGLWGLVNNAGQNFIGDIELTTMTQYLEIANVNLFGMVRMCKAFLPLLRQSQGRVVNVTSVKGLFAIPSNAAYTMTKFGGEAFSETLSQEMTDHGVTVSVVEPGNFGGITGCLDDKGLKTLKRFLDEQWDEASEATKQFYGQAHVQHQLEDAKKSASTTHRNVTPVLDAMEDALLSQCPKFRYLVDGSNSYIDVYNSLARISPYIPVRIFNKVRAYFFPYIIYK